MSTIETKERPILFTPTMAQAVYEGRKTQTRRVVKPQPLSMEEDPKFFEKTEMVGDECSLCGYDECPPGFRPTRKFRFDRKTMARLEFLRPAVDRKPTKAQVRREMERRRRPDEDWCSEREILGLCPYRARRLVVRESITHSIAAPKIQIAYKADGMCVGCGQDGDGGYTQIFHGWLLPDVRDKGPSIGRAAYGPWKPNIHMPRWACRSLLEVLSVRVERVESITEEDAIAEGFASRADFLHTFYTINKRAEKGSNPWVWVIGFKKTQEN